MDLELEHVLVRRVVRVDAEVDDLVDRQATRLQRGLGDLAGSEGERERAAAVRDAGRGDSGHEAGREGQDRDFAVREAEEPRRPVGAGHAGEADTVGVEGEHIGAMEQVAAAADGDEQAGLGGRVDDRDHRRVHVDLRPSVTVRLATYVPASVGVHSATRPMRIATVVPRRHG